MNDENTKKLLNDFPRLYKLYHTDVYTSCMAQGFCIGDGWFKVLYDLSKSIDELCKDLSDGEYPTVDQVKEKFGTLRYYINLSTIKDGFLVDSIDNLIHDAEDKCLKICDVCGELGSYRKDYMAVLCNKHYEESDIE